MNPHRFNGTLQTAQLHPYIFIALGSPVNAEIFAPPVLSASHKSMLFPEQLYA
jgi:hypothetical protein